MTIRCRASSPMALIWQEVEDIMLFGSIQGLSLETFEVSTEALGLLSPMTAEFPIPSRVINRGGQPTRNFLVTAVLRVLP